jgi:porphobilinogen synthase
MKNVLIKRPRRLRGNIIIRDMVADININASKLIMPYFVSEKNGIMEEISSMPGIYRFSIDNLMRELESDSNAGVRSIILFGIPEEKDSYGRGAWKSNSIIQRTVRRIKKELGLFVITDVCLCEYTSHGHCGISDGKKILNDQSLDLIARTALSHADAGADMVAPSDMMDGRIATIRRLLDDNGYSDLPIMSYSAKYSSAFYGPFREAACSAPAFGDRKTYQMDPRNKNEAITEAEIDIEEGADIIMVKPTLAYLDIIRAVRENVNAPVCAYNVSGEYLMVKLMAQKGFDEASLTMETLTGIFRAGANMAISYHTRDAIKNKWLVDN